MHYQQRHFINFILHIYFLPKLVFLFKPDYFHHTLYTLNIPITSSHNMVMAHTPAQNFYLFVVEHGSLQRTEAVFVLHNSCAIQSPISKKKFSFIRDGYVQFTSLKDKKCLQKYFYESKVYSSFHHSYQISQSLIQADNKATYKRYAIWDISVNMSDQHLSFTMRESPKLGDFSLPNCLFNKLQTPGL